MTDLELLQTRSAQVWAEEFCQLFPGKVAVDIMEGWFAGAMAAQEMAMRREPERWGLKR